MEQTLNVENIEIHFKFNEEAKCWQTKTIIDGLEIEIEIDPAFHNGNEVDWEHFKSFFSFVNQENRFRSLIKDTRNLVTELGKGFFRGCYDEVSDFKMNFLNSIYYNGKTNGQFIQNGYSYSLIFSYYAERESGIYADDYANYLVDIENHFIVGTRRQQC
jgi:hypothetical protein